MNLNKNAWRSISFAGVVLAAGLFGGGCQTDKSSVTDFFPQDEERSIDQFATAQAAAGARADATLQSFHFDGAKLNTLGEAKLDLLLRDDDTAEPVVVYLNLAKDDSQSQARRDAVSAYLGERGLAKEQIAFKDGPNPDVTSLSANHLARTAKLESSAAAAGDADASAAGASSGSADASK